MQIVIEFPKEVWERYINLALDGEALSYWGNLIANGIPLPKGHGRLIDADVVIDNLFNSSLYDDDYYYGIAWSKVKNTPTIIEADKEEK